MWATYIVTRNDRGLFTLSQRWRSRVLNEMPIKRLVHNVVTCHPFGVDVVIESEPRTHTGPRLEAGVQLIGSKTMGVGVVQRRGGCS